MDIVYCDYKNDCNKCPYCPDCEKIRKCARISIDKYPGPTSPKYNYASSALKGWKIFDSCDTDAIGSLVKDKIKTFEIFLSYTITKEDLEKSLRYPWPCGCHFFPDSNQNT